MTRETERMIQTQLRWERAKRAPIGFFGFMVIGLMLSFGLFEGLGWLFKTFNW